MTTWFTADTHFGHKNILKYCNRPYDSVEEMNETIINNWNSVIQPLDVVYHLGDFCFGNPWKYLNRLNGYIKFIVGGHDKELSKNIYKAEDGKMMLRKFNYGNLLEVEFDVEEKKQLIVMCHYSMRKWNRSHYGSFHLYGHSHGKLPGIGRSMDVGTDTNNFYPYSLEQITSRLSSIEFGIEQESIQHE